MGCISVRRSMQLYRDLCTGELAVPSIEQERIPIAIHALEQRGRSRWK